MKKYFAKYPPVDDGEEIHFCKACNKQGLRNCAHPEECGQLETQKVNLFLCTRDMQIGDKVTVYPDSNRHHQTGVVVRIDNQIHVKIDDLDYDELEEKITSHNYNKKDVIKIIGEISPEATWVNNGGEFDEDQIRFVLFHTSVYQEIPVSYSEWLVEDKVYYRKYIQIMGPCGHFH